MPGMFFLLAFGTKRTLTRQSISPLSRLPSHQAAGRGGVWSSTLFRLTSSPLFKEHAVGREFGEMWIVNLVLPFFYPPPEVLSRQDRSRAASE